MSNVIQMNKAVDIKALYAAIPEVTSKNLLSQEAESMFEALAMMEPAQREESIRSCDDPMLAAHYQSWLRYQQGLENN